MISFMFLLMSIQWILSKPVTELAPVPNGLSISEANCLLTEMIQLPNIAAFELVEVNPCLDDKKNKMAEVAFELIQNMVKVLEKAKNGK